MPGDIINKIIVTMEDFMDVIKEMEPSAMREVFVECRHKMGRCWRFGRCKAGAYGGSRMAAKYQGIFTHADATPPKGILLYGPPVARLYWLRLA